MAFFIKQNDTSPAILRQFLDSAGNPVNLTGATVVFNMASQAGALVCNAKPATVFAGTLPAELGGATVTALDGWMKYAWAAVDTLTPGEYIAEFQVTFTDTSIETVPNSAYETVTIAPDISPSNYPYLPAAPAATLAVGGFATRAEFVAWIATASPSIGQVIEAGGFSYRYIGSGTAIADLPGWVPYGNAYPDHWAVNTTPGTTDMTAAIKSAMSYSRTVYFMGVTYKVAAATNDILDTNASGTVLIGQGIGATKIVGTGSAAAACFLIRQNGPLKIYDMTLEITATGTTDAKIIRVVTSDLTAVRVKFDGNPAYVSGMPTQIGYGLAMQDTGTMNNIICEDCEFTRLHWPFFKKNTATSSQDNVRFFRCQFYANFREDIGLNSPLGSLTNVAVKDCHFRDHAGTAAGITDSRMYITMASVNGAVVEGNTFKGTVQQLVHLEYWCRRVTVTGNTGYCDFPANGGFCHISANNTDGTNRAPTDITVTGNSVQCITANTATTGVWVFNNNYTGSPTMSGIVVSGNVMLGFEYGYYLDNESDGGVKIAGNNARACTYGYRALQDSSIIEGNTSEECTYGLYSSGGMFRGHTFVNCTNTVFSATTNLGAALVNPAWVMPQFVALVSTFNNFPIFPLMADTIAYGFLSAFGTSEQAGRAAETIWEVTWDGATLTQTQKVTRAASSVTLTLSKIGNDLNVRYFENTPQLNNASMNVHFNGTIALRQ